MKKFCLVLCSLFLALVFNTTSANIHTVVQSGNSFVPASVNANLGDTIRWVWTCCVHTSTSTNIPSGASSWDASLNSGSQQFDYIPAVAGTYHYGSTPLAGAMIGSIQVSGPPVIIAAWTFDTLAAQPNTPLVIAAEHGTQTTASIFMDGSNGSSLWLPATQLNSFVGSTLNDFRTSPVSGMSLCPINPGNGNHIVFKFSMTGLENIKFSFATRGTGTGFNYHQWAYSTDGTNFTLLDSTLTNTANTTATWLLREFEFDTIAVLNGAADVYIRLTPIGTSSTGSGNNRLDNIVIKASAASAPAVLPTLTTSTPSSITPSSAVSGGNITSDGGTAITARGVCWSISQNPDITDSITTDGSGTGAFVSNVGGLTPNTTYYLRAYATNSVGTAYGNEVSFTTTTSAVAASVVMDSVTSVLDTSAIFYANVVSDGGSSVTARGFVYGTGTSPGFGNAFVQTGSGTGSYSAAINNLSPATTYFVRSYAINAIDTAYSSDMTFSTIVLSVPVLTTDSVIGIGVDHATAYAAVASDGGLAITDRGFCYSVNPSPDLNDSVIIVSGGVGSYNQTITALMPNTAYYLRAFATNSMGTAFGNELSFTTQAAGTVLHTGDLAFLAYATTNPDRFAFILLKDVNSNTVISFTDNAWDESVNPPVLKSNEQTSVWTAPQGGLTAGSVILIEGLTVIGGGSVVGQLNGLALAGDQILAYQGDPSAPDFIAGISSGTWINTGAPNNNQSYLPLNLVIGYSAIDFGTHANNGYYNNTLIWGTESQLLGAIHDPANWVRDASTQTWPTYTFTIGLPPDTIPPVAISATALDSVNILIAFNEALDITSATDTANFALANANVVSATLNSTLDTVHVVLDTPLISGQTDTIFVSNVADSSMNYMTQIYKLEVLWFSSAVEPIVSATTISMVGPYSANASASVVHNGGSPVTQRGFCISTSPNPTINDDTVLVSGASGAFDAVISGLNHNTNYYIRAFAVNNAGIGYGAEISFSTLIDGIDKVDDLLNLLIYPNPANDMIRVETNIDACRIDLYSLSGSLIKSVDSHSKVTDITLENFEKGLYILRLTDVKNSNSTYRKIIIL